MSKLNNKVIRKAYLSWMRWPFAMLNAERQCGPGVVKMFNDVREDLYPGDEDMQQDLLQRHQNFFNTEIHIGAVIGGILLGMEAERSEGKDIPDSLIQSIKTALGGPFAGLGDSLLAGTLCPILLGIALGLSQNGEITGPLFYMIALPAIMIPFTWLTFKAGTKLGIGAAEKILAGGIKDRITNAIDIVGLCVVGAIVAQYASVNIGLTYINGDMTISVGEILNSALPGLPTIGAFLGTFYLMKNKNVGIVKMILLFLVIAVVGYFTTILA